MIQESQLIEVGYITKLHGLKGELQATITDTVFDDIKRCPYLVVKLDGIFVPFFLTGYRFRSATGILLSFEDIDSQEKAEPFCGLTLYFDRRWDQQLGPIGEITGIDDQTVNILFLVDHEGEEVMIPAAEDLILSVDDEAQTILMNLPIGLINTEDAEIDE